MKTNYKPTDKVIINKPGSKMDSLPGTVLSNGSGTNFKPLSVVLDNNLGTWQFTYAEVMPVKGEKEEKYPFDKPKDKTKKVK